MRIGSLLSNIKERLFPEEWTLAIRERKGALLFQDAGRERPFQLLPNDHDFWSGDPFLFEEDGKAYLFFELFDRRLMRGAIGCRAYCNGDWGEAKIVFSADYHLSFPFVFRRDDAIYMMPEAYYSRCIPLLRAVSFPYEWELVEKIMSGRSVCDSILYSADSNEYLFTQPVVHPYTFAELELYVRSAEGWKAHPESPICKNQSRGARMAGSIIETQGKLYRVGQDCSNGYGNALQFFEINELTPEHYRETSLCNLTPDNILLDVRKKFHGCHTYNVSAHFEVLDLKSFPFRPGNLVG